MTRSIRSEASPPTFTPTARDLLDEPVAAVLKRVDGALDLLVQHGFEPLATPALRRVLAPTVTLRQALRLRALTPDREQALLERLAELVRGAREGATCR